MLTKIQYSEKSLMTLFTPDKQAAYSMHPDRCINGTAPSIRRMANAYGDKSAASWLVIQLADLFRYTGARIANNPLELMNYAYMLISEYGDLKLTEWMLFFNKFKSGTYGHFYGNVDFMRVGCSLRDFYSWRNNEKRRIEEEENRRIREERDKNKECISFEDYLKLKKQE